MTRLTVFFDDPWWVGVVEVERDGALRAYRHIFGAEPRDEEVLQFVLGELTTLLDRPAIGVEAPSTRPRKTNPKRLAREAARAVQERGVSTRAQEALQRQQEATLKERKAARKAQREQADNDRREKAREKVKARHRGRA